MKMNELSEQNERKETSMLSKSAVERSVICGFSRAWIGPCKTHINKEGNKCHEHSEIKCSSCGEQATRECYETGQFVCGAPLCDDCEHTRTENGTNVGIGFDAQLPTEGMKSHCKKTEQRYLPWYQRDEAKSI